MPVGHPFDNIAYGSASWRQQEDSEKYYKSDIQFGSSAPNEVRVNINSRAHVGGHHILFENAESVFLPSSVSVETTFYFYVTADNANKSYSDLKFSETVPVANSYTGLQDLLLGRLVVPAGTVSVDWEEVYVYNLADSRVLRLLEANILDSEFTGMIYDQAINLISTRIPKPFVLLDSIDGGYYPILNQIIADKHQGEAAFSIEYRMVSIANPSELIITPNAQTYQYDYLTDNYVTPITKYGDFCMENYKDSKLSVTNRGKYLSKLKKTSDTINIGFFGDSLTRGWDSVNGTPETYFDDNGDSLSSPVVADYPGYVIALLEDMYGARFSYQNLGWSGGTVKDLYERYWINRNHDICVIMIGTNDNTQNLTPENYEKYYSSFIARQLYFGSFPIIVSSITKLEKDTDDLNIYRAIAKNLAKKYDLYFVDGAEMTENFDNSLYSDATHLNQDGYALMGRVLSVPFIENILTNKQKIRSGSQILFNNSNFSFKGNGSVLRSFAYPTVGTDIGFNDFGTAITLTPGESVYIPFFAEEENLYIFPQIYFISGNSALDIFMGETNRVPQAKNAYYDFSNDVANPMARYGKWASVGINNTLANFRSGTVFNLVGSLQNNTPTGNFTFVSKKGENLLYLKNNSTDDVAIHLVEFYSEIDYLGATGQSGGRFFKDGSPINLANSPIV